MLAIGNIASTQEEVKSIEAQVALRRNASKEWKWKNIIPCDVVFIIDNNNITTNDKLSSIYTTYETIIANENKGMWKALDQKGKQCTFKIEYDYPLSKIEIEFKNRCYRYFFKP